MFLTFVDPLETQFSIFEEKENKRLFLNHTKFKTNWILRDANWMKNSWFFLFSMRVIKNTHHEKNKVNLSN